MEDPIDRAVHEEIESLHEFFVGWFAGTLREELLDECLRARFDPGFVLIPPGGELLTLDALEGALRSAHGSNPEFRITIRDVRIRHVSDDWILATYEEWQRNAKASQPPDNGRVSTVLFGRSGPLRWLHVHETWLPEAVMAAGPYDF